MSLLITNIKQLVNVQEAPKPFLNATEMAAMVIQENAWLLIEGETIKDFGVMSVELPRADKTIDAKGGLVLPAWCDSHTHLVFAKNRSGEFVQRIEGASYEEIAAAGGGILNSAKMLGETSEEALLDSTLERAAEIISFGTGAVEIKSGYGLTLESELKILRVARKVREQTALQVRTTFLGAHAFPTEFKNDRNAYINLVCDKMIPQVADEGLAEYCDVFCEKGFFTIEEATYILECGLRHGLKPKVHANQIHNSGGIQVGVQQGAISVDHLEEVGPEEISALQNSKTMPTLLPAASFFLNMKYAPARTMLEAGLPLALASDFNPGSCPTGNMQFILSLACVKLRMTPTEAIAAATSNSAYAMEVQDELGSISKGKRANIILTKPMESIAEIPYYFGGNHIRSVYLNGKLS